MTAPSAPDNVTSRFRVTERPLLSPGQCAVCGAADRPVVEYGATIQFYGTVMLCELCVCEAAEQFGMVRAKELEDSKVQTGQSIEDYLLLTNQVVVTHEFYSAFSDAVRRFPNALDRNFGPMASALESAVEGSGEAVPGQLSIVFDDDESDDSESKPDSPEFDLGVD